MHARLWRPSKTLPPPMLDMLTNMRHRRHFLSLIFFRVACSSDPCLLLSRCHYRVLKAFSMRQLIDVLTYDFSPVRRKFQTTCPLLSMNVPCNKHDIDSFLVLFIQKIGKDGRSRIYLPHFEGEPSNEPMSALEVAISGRAKHFISNPLVQEIISMIPFKFMYAFQALLFRIIA